MTWTVHKFGGTSVADAQRAASALDERFHGAFTALLSRWPAVFGGTAPLVATMVMERSGSPLAPGWYVSLCAILSLIVLSTVRGDAKGVAEVHTGTH